MPRQRAQRWRLTDPYLDLVWAAHLGPTATLVARHLGHAFADGRSEIDIAEVAVFIGRGDDRSSGRRHVVRAFERLSAAKIVAWSPDQATITLSGYIAPAPAELLARLPSAVADVHERLQATGGPTAPATSHEPTVDAGGPSACANRAVPFGVRRRGGGGLGR